MDKVEEVKKVITERKHRFCCDNCQKYLGTSIEHDDGYYKEIGEFFFSSGCYYIKKHFCEECKDKFMEKYENVLIELGFKRE